MTVRITDPSPYAGFWLTDAKTGTVGLTEYEGGSGVTSTLPRDRTVRSCPMSEAYLKVALPCGEFTVIDAADLDIIAPYSWSSVQHARAGTKYAIAHQKGASASGNQLRMHRIILGVSIGEYVDHRNGNGLDNRRSNLRIATVHQNAMNHPRQRNNTSGYKGVCQRSNGHWQAYIYWHGRQIALGAYLTPDEAARAYDAAARELFGEYARLNFPDHIDIIDLDSISETYYPAQYAPRRSGPKRPPRPPITHCPQGHEYTPENTYLTSKNGRSCRACARMRARLKRDTREAA